MVVSPLQIRYRAGRATPPANGKAIPWWSTWWDLTIERGWCTRQGHGAGLHITERFHRRDFGQAALELAITVDDPKTYTKPFTVNVNQTLHPNTDLIEFVCAESEKGRRAYAG